MSLWYDSTWNWTPVFKAIGEHFTHRPMSHGYILSNMTEKDFELRFFISLFLFRVTWSKWGWKLFNNCSKFLILQPVFLTFLSHYPECHCDQTIEYKMFYLINEYFEWERFIVCSCHIWQCSPMVLVWRFWLISCQSCGTMHLCLIHLSIIASKLKEILLSVRCLFFIWMVSCIWSLYILLYKMKAPVVQWLLS